MLNVNFQEGCRTESELVWIWELLIYFRTTVPHGMWEILLWTHSSGLGASNVMVRYCTCSHCFKLEFSNPVQRHGNSCCFLHWSISLRNDLKKKTQKKYFFELHTCSEQVSPFKFPGWKEKWVVSHLYT